MSKLNKILLVEDEPIVVDSVCRILGAEGLQVDFLNDVEQALEKLKNEIYNIVISDLMLPNISGLELITKAKKIDENIIVIIITGYANIENALKSFKLGAFDFLPKPFDYEELIAVVFRAMNFFELMQRSRHNQEPLVTDREKIKGEEAYYFLGQHAWARREKDGVVTIGIAETFHNTMGEIASIELPNIKSEVWQGNLSARIIAKNNLNHLVWAPLSGQVIGINTALSENWDIINVDPFHKGWLFKILPNNMEEELENLDAL